MKNTNTYHFSGHITTLEPLTVSLAKSKSRGHEMPKNNGIPYFPSSSLIGAIRNAGCKYVIDQLASGDSPLKLDLNTVYSICQGYVVDNKVADEIMKSKTTTPVDKDESLRDVNPLLSIFGRWGLAGKLGVGSAYASREDHVQRFDGGFRTDIFERDEELLATLSSEDVQRYFDLVKDQSETALDVSELKKEKTKLNKQLKTAPEEEKALLRQKVEDLDNQIKEAKDERGEGRETIRRPIDSMEAIVANTQLKHRMTLKRGTDIELGAVLYSLANFSRSAQLGGKARHNWGKVQAEWVIKIPQEDFTNKEVGKVGFNDDGFFVEGDLLKESMAAFKAALDSNKFNFSQLV